MKIYFLRNKISALFILLVLVSIFLVSTSALLLVDNAKKALTDSLPDVFNENNGDLITSKLRQEAVMKFPLYQLPATKKEWELYRVNLKNLIVKKTGALINQKLPLNV